MAPIQKAEDRRMKARSSSVSNGIDNPFPQREMSKVMNDSVQSATSVAHGRA